MDDSELLFEISDLIYLLRELFNKGDLKVEEDIIYFSVAS